MTKRRRSHTRILALPWLSGRPVGTASFDWQGLPLWRRTRMPRVGSLWRPGVTIPVMFLLMFVSSDYKLRIRDIGQSLTATPDLNTIVEICVYGLIFVMAGRVVLLSRGHRTQGMKVMYLVWLYAGYMALTELWAIYPVLGGVRAWQFVVTLTVVVVVARFGTRLDMHRLALGYAMLVSASVIFGMVFKFPRLRLQQDRFNWLYVHPVIAGSYLAVAVLLVTWMLLCRLRRSLLVSPPFLLLVVMLGLTVGGLLATKTRGSIGACAVGIAVLVLMALRRYRAATGAAGLIALVLVGLYVLGPILGYLERGEGESSLTSFNGRTPLWAEAWRLFQIRPLTGYGITASRGLFWNDVALGGAHNAVVNVAVDGGLIGLALWAALVLAVFRRLPALMKTADGFTDAPLLGAVLTALLVNGVTTEGMGYIANVNALWFFVVTAWTVMLIRVLAERLQGQRPRRRPRLALTAQIALPHAGTGRLPASHR